MFYQNSSFYLVSQTITIFKKSDQNRRFRYKNKKEKSQLNSNTCKSCNKDFECLAKHLAKKPTCKQLYSKVEIEAIAKMKRSAKNRRYRVKHKKETAQYNSRYYSINRKHLRTF